MSIPLKQTLESEFNFRLNKNQIKNIQRLFFEITRRDNVSVMEVINYLKENSPWQNCKGQDVYNALVSCLIRLRFPLTSKRRKINLDTVFLSQLKNPLQTNWQVDSNFKPLEIYVEKQILSTDLVRNFNRLFPDVVFSQMFL